MIKYELGSNDNAYSMKTTEHFLQIAFTEAGFTRDNGVYQEELLELLALADNNPYLLQILLRGLPQRCSPRERIETLKDRLILSKETEAYARSLNQ